MALYVFSPLIVSYLNEEYSRRSLSRRRIYRKHDDAFGLPEDVFIAYFRLPKFIVLVICDELREYLEPRSENRNAISTERKVLCALRFFACGSYQQSIANEFCLQVSQPTASRAVSHVAAAINRKLLRKWVKFPKNPRQHQELKTDFMRLAGFPGVIGAIDCTHVKIVAPPCNDSICPEHIFINRHCSHSINVQMICDANQKIINCNAKFPGSTHDAFIWRTSAARRIMQDISLTENTTWLLGDSGYPLEEMLLTPRLDAAENSPDHKYNIALCKTRNVIERCFGVLKSRFRCLLGERVLHYRPQVASKIINACAVLHNMCKTHGVPDPPPCGNRRNTFRSRKRPFTCKSTFSTTRFDNQLFQLKQG